METKKMTKLTTNVRSPSRLTPQELQGRFNGVIAFPVTPFTKDLTLNLTALRQNVATILEQPVCAMVAPSGTGELFALTSEEQQEVLEAVVEEVRGRVPVIAAVGVGVPEAVQQAQLAARLGADGILAFPPYYPNAPEDGLEAYYRAIGAATPLGLLIYSRDWATFTPEMVERLAGIPTLVGWKDGQGDVRKLQAIQRRVGDRLAWIGGAGDDLVPAYYATGIRCYTSSIVNWAPQLSMDLHRLAAAGDHAALGRLMKEFVVPLYEFRGRRRGYEVAVMKAGMEMMGMTAGPVRPPLCPLRSEELVTLHAMLEPWRKLLAKPAR
jgi:5-dehydro-4-deoxyglucarate dehydratase